MRRAPEPIAPKKEQEPKPVEKKNERDRDRAEEKKYKDAVGRKVKGRGALRYNGRSRSRSRTPPHWRRANEQRYSFLNLAHSSSYSQTNAQTFVRSKDEEVKREIKREDYRDRDRDYDRDRRKRSSQERYDKKRDDSGKYY